MYAFELRRVFRQRQRNRVPIGNKKIDLFAMARQRVIVKFSIFFAGWCFLGHLMFTKFFFDEKDEKGGRLFTSPETVSQIVRIKREEHLNSFMPSFKSPPQPAVSHPFDA